MDIKSFFKIAVCSFAFSAAQVNAGTASFYLDQSNELLDGINYVQVTISDSSDAAGDIDFLVELIEPAFVVNDLNFGMQDFSFNFDNALAFDASNIINLSSPDWTFSQNKNAGGGFGKYHAQLSGTGKSRTEQLSFTITGIEGDNIYSYVMSSMLNPDADVFFATHIAGFDYANGVSSAKFGGLAAAPAVPVPASVWLFGSGLLGLAGMARRKLA